MPFLSTKDLAKEMGCHPRTVRRWWKLLQVKPTIAANGANRWTPAAAKRLFKRWEAYWTKRNQLPGEATRKFSGLVKRCREKRQLRLKLLFK